MAKKYNVTINGKQYYRMTKKIGVKPNGKPDILTVYGDGEKDAKKKMAEKLRGMEAGLARDFDKMTFGQLFKKWFYNVKKIAVSESSFARYEAEYRLRIQNSPIYPLILTKITPIVMQEFYNNLSKEYSYKTLMATNKVLSMFFRYCVEVDYLVKSPLRTVVIPRLEESNETKDEGIKVFTLEDEAIIKTEANNNKHFIFLFTLFTGLRFGEALGLTHKDIDLESKVVHVTKQLSIDGKKLKPLKTKYSRRDVPLASALVPLLKNYIRQEKEKHLRKGIQFTQDQPLFSSRECTFKPQRNVRRQWESFRSKHNIEKLPYKTLRATFGTILAENGVPIKQTSVLMGHSSIKVTEKCYVTIRTNTDNPYKENYERGLSF